MPRPQATTLREGERLNRAVFHLQYLDTPEDFRAELIGGVVHIPPPGTIRCGRASGKLLSWLSDYRRMTPGTEALTRVTILLDDQSEPEPNACLLILPERGRQTREKDEYLTGPPELVVEVTDLTEELDLGPKKADYQRAGVIEYIVAAVRRQRVFWFVRQGEELVELPPDPDGVLRSPAFPGLWLDPAALLRSDYDRMKEVLDAGLAIPEHAAFVARLSATP
jgi:Uma2 family endonuclease